MSYPPYQQPILDANRLITTPWQLFFNQLSTAGGGGAPTNATYVLTIASGSLPNGQVATNSTTITIDTSTPNQIQWQRTALTGDITAPANSNATTLSTTGVTANTYGDATHVAQFTVDAKGRLSAASNVAITGAGGVALLKGSKTLTDTDIKNLGVPTAVTILSALGANTTIMPLFFVLKAYTSAGAYTGLTDGAFIGIEYVTGPELISGYIANDSTTTPVLSSLTSLLGTTTNKVLKLNTPFSFETDPLSNQWGNIDSDNTMTAGNNSALQIRAAGLAGVLGGGNAANSLVVETYYVPVSV